MGHMPGVKKFQMLNFHRIHRLVTFLGSSCPPSMLCFGASQAVSGYMLKRRWRIICRYFSATLFLYCCSPLTKPFESSLKHGKRD